MKYLLIAIALSLPLQTMVVDWEAPLNPDPRAILDEAREDARAGRYEDALIKHLWFHHHALEYKPSLYGVRLAPALMGWHTLAKVYPPAMEKLRETRDEAVQEVLEHKDKIRQAFHDMAAINWELGEEERTVAVFILLDKEAPDVAKTVYDRAQSALIKAKEFTLCGKYLEPEKSYARMVELYPLDLKHAKTAEPLERKVALRELAEQRFLEEAATLIALLVINDRKPEAERIAKDAKKVSKYRERDSVIDAALEGNLP